MWVWVGWVWGVGEAVSVCGGSGVWELWRRAVAPSQHESAARGERGSAAAAGWHGRRRWGRRGPPLAAAKACPERPPARATPPRAAGAAAAGGEAGAEGVRCEVGSVLYEPNLLGSKGPRRMTVLLPKLDPREGRTLPRRVGPDTSASLLAE